MHKSIQLSNPGNAQSAGHPTQLFDSVAAVQHFNMRSRPELYEVQGTCTHNCCCYLLQQGKWLEPMIQHNTTYRPTSALVSSRVGIAHPKLLLCTPCVMRNRSGLDTAQAHLKGSAAQGALYCCHTQECHLLPTCPLHVQPPLLITGLFK